MSRIAIIDDAIQEEFLANKTVKEHIILYEEKPGQKGIETANPYTHATTCAIILEACTENYEIINLQIMKDCKTPANINSLVRALEICLDLEVDIISMSVGTVRLSESLKLNKIMKELGRREVIMVAASSNQQLLTLPASYPEVIGVQCDIHGSLEPLKIAVHSNWWLGLQITANCNLDFPKKYLFDPTSNSFAVPVVVSYINTYLNKNKNSNLECVLQYFDKISSKDFFQTFDQKVFESSTIEIPHVCLVLHEGISFELGKEIMNDLYESYHIECVGFTRNKSLEDIRFFNMEECGLKPENIEVFLEKFCEADLIVSMLSKNDFINWGPQFDIDLVITIDTKQTEFEVKNRKYVSLIGEESRNIGYIGDFIIEVLS